MAPLECLPVPPPAPQGAFLILAAEASCVLSKVAQARGLSFCPPLPIPNRKVAQGQWGNSPSPSSGEAGRPPHDNVFRF